MRRKGRGGLYIYIGTRRGPYIGTRHAPVRVHVSKLRKERNGRDPGCRCDAGAPRPHGLRARRHHTTSPDRVFPRKQTSAAPTAPQGQHMAALVALGTARTLRHKTRHLGRTASVRPQLTLHRSPIVALHCSGRRMGHQPIASRGHGAARRTTPTQSESSAIRGPSPIPNTQAKRTQSPHMRDRLARREMMHAVDTIVTVRPPGAGTRRLPSGTVAIAKGGSSGPTVIEDDFAARHEARGARRRREPTAGNGRRLTRERGRQPSCSPSP